MVKLKRAKTRFKRTLYVLLFMFALALYLAGIQFNKQVQVKNHHSLQTTAHKVLHSAKKGS
jgi:hypothetical protein